MTIVPDEAVKYHVSYEINYEPSLRLCLFNSETGQGVYSNLSKRAVRRIIWLLLKGYFKAL